MLSETDTEKNILRENIRARRKEMSDRERDEKSLLISDFVLSLDSFNEENTIFCYVPLKYEVNTFPLIEKALDLGKRVAVPRCIVGKPLMDFFFIKNIGDLEKGSYNISEPSLNCEKCNDFKGLIIIPALSFDFHGFRLGYGKGYYDRFLDRFSGTKVGLCFDEFISGALPHDRFDKRAELIVTEKGIIKAK